MSHQITITSNYEVNGEPFEDIINVDFDEETAQDIELEYIPESQGGPIVRPKKARI